MVLRIIVFALVGFSLIASVWKCSKEEYSTNSFCVCTKTPHTLYKEGFNYHYIKDAKEKSFEWIDQTKNYCYQVTAPYIIKMKAGYQWSEKTTVKTALRQFGNVLRPLFYTADDQLRPLRFVNKIYVRYRFNPWTWLKEAVNLQCKKWLYQLEGYVNSLSTKSTQQSNGNLPDKEDSMVEDKLKKTAKRILDYIDQLNQQSIKTGMKQEVAKEKAHEIIKSITESTTQRTGEIIPEPDTTDSDAGVAAFEIQSIMETAVQEKLRLDDQLDLILSRVQTLSSEKELNEDTDLFISALKTEIDQLRVTAENSVRERTKLGLKHVEEIKTNALVTAHMKEDLQSAQRAALKELRQIYVKLYKTNKEIDKIMHL
jgi:hypothetical protein